jgi:hypothetical protein
MGLLSHFSEMHRLSGVVRLSQDFREESSGYQNEHIREEFVCRNKDGQARHMKVYWYVRIMGSTNCTVEEDKAISEDEYEAHRKKRGVLDTPAYRAAKDRRDELVAQLDKLTPKCRECGSQMVSRTGPYGEFWGCASFPRCKATRKGKPSGDAVRKAVADELAALLGDSF